MVPPAIRARALPGPSSREGRRELGVPAGSAEIHLAYPWLWVGKQVHVVKQETIDEFYSPTWGLPGSSVPGSSASNKGIDVGSE